MVSSLAIHEEAISLIGDPSLGLVATIALILFLIAKVILAVADEPRLALLSQHVDAAIMPLLIVFVAVLAMNIVSKLGTE